MSAFSALPVRLTAMALSCAAFWNMHQALDAAPRETRLQPTPAPDEHVAPYIPRFGRTRPVIAVIGQNDGTELTDYVIPYGLLRRADVGEVVSVATRAGPMAMRPALHIQPQADIARFDQRFPEGADYVIVPAVGRRDDPALLGWIRQQAAKGATLVSICDGALVLADTGLLDGHRATAHWATRGYRRKAYPAVRWIDDRRYVADGRLVSSAGISAAIPTALALVEAIAGHDRATTVAQQLQVADWSARHDSRWFEPKLGRNLSAFAATEVFNSRLHRPQSTGIAVADGTDEIAVALAADAYARTGRARVVTVGSAGRAVTLTDGLALLPDRNDANGLDRMIALPPVPAGHVLDRTLADIAHLYGRTTAYGVALDFEYPGFHG